jgi:hypothetical protein
MSSPEDPILSTQDSRSSWLVADDAQTKTLIKTKAQKSVPAVCQIPETGLKQFLWVMEERQRIFLAKVQGLPRPWTSDQIFHTQKFENVYRENDRQSRWLIENWLRLFSDHPNLAFSIALFRRGLNWSESAAAVGFPDVWDPDKVLAILEERAKNGAKNFGTGYRMVYPHMAGKGAKPRAMVRLLDDLYRRFQTPHLPWLQHGATLERCHEWFTDLPGWGAGLYAYEFVTDLSYCDKYLAHASDLNSWANPGPGAKRGINRLLNRGLEDDMPREEQIDRMREIFAWADSHRDPAILTKLDLRAIEQTACIYDKWCRGHGQLAGGKRVTRELYKPGPSV